MNHICANHRMALHDDAVAISNLRASPDSCLIIEGKRAALYISGLGAVLCELNHKKPIKVINELLTMQ